LPSRLARALWIEIHPDAVNVTSVTSRLARALWIEIVMSLQVFETVFGRGSREPCGLKSFVNLYSRPARLVEARESLVD